MDGGDPVAEAGEARGGGGEGVGIRSRPSTVSRSVAVEQGLAVAASAEVASSTVPGGTGAEHVDDLVDHHRLVLERRG